MKKKFLQLSLSLIFVLSLCVPLNGPALASNESAAVVQPNFTYINVFNCGMDINSSGRASMNSTIIAYSGTVDQVRMSNYLQRYLNGAWTTVNSWNQTTGGTSASWSKTYYVSSGYSYRLRTYFYMYDGSTIIESTSATSNSVYY